MTKTRAFSRTAIISHLAVLAAVLATAALALCETPAGAVTPRAADVVLRCWPAPAVREMRDGALINTNRSYAFQKVTDDIRGLEFAAQAHGAPEPLEVRISEGGVFRLLIWGGATPESLGLPGTWARSGDIEDPYSREEHAGWTVFATAAAAGDSFRIPTPDRWGVVVLAHQIIVDDDPAWREHERLQRQIAGHRPEDPTYHARWQRLLREARHPAALIHDNDRDPLDVVMRRTRALLEDLRRRSPAAPDLVACEGDLQDIEQAAAATPLADEAARRDMFSRTCRLRRRIALANPLLDFNRLVFLTHHRAMFEHMCDQYYGFHARPGGGLYILEDAFGPEPRARRLLENTPVKEGRLAGTPLQDGSFVSLDLDWNAETVLFAWTEAERTVDRWTPRSTYHVFRASLDGSRLEQLTDGPCNDFDPCFLPGGRIAFISERRGGFLRCGGPRLNPTYTLFGMRPDGSDVICLSYHETHEWHPSVDNDGMLAYTRWDYVDRDSDVAHHLWTCYPDGRDPRSLHGNYPRRREMRPWMEMSIRAVPDSRRYIAVAAPHHGQAYGSVILIDPRPGDDNATGQIERLTPDVAFPESEVAPGQPHEERGRNTGDWEVFGTPWPLSEDYFLCVYDPGEKHYAICLADSFGNREIIYSAPDIACLDPIPLRPRRRPPVIPPATLQAADGRPAGEPAPTTGTIAVMNVYDSARPWPDGAEIKALRVVQLYPKTTVAAADPKIGVGDQSLARGVLGTVPVQPDGSVRFTAPAGVPLYFQALDAEGLAVQSMRSDTYLHAGETLTCHGCHEPKRAPASHKRASMPIAFRRPPERLRPEAEGSNPVLFPRLVQPVLDRRCADCHARHPDRAPSLNARVPEASPWGWSEAFHSLEPFAWARHGGNGALYAKNESLSYSIPGEIGALASRLYAMLRDGHHDVRLSPEEMRRITLWLDTNSNFFGAYHETSRQAGGVEVKPTLF